MHKFMHNAQNARGASDQEIYNMAGRSSTADFVNFSQVGVNLWIVSGVQSGPEFSYPQAGAAGLSLQH